MANLLGWLKKEASTVYHGITPFDDGQGWTTQKPVQPDISKLPPQAQQAYNQYQQLMRNKPLAGVGLAILQQGQLFGRALAQLGATAEQAITHKPVTFIPNRWTGALTGKEPIQSIQVSSKQAETSHPGGFHIKGTPITLTPRQTGIAQTGLSLAQDIPIGLMAGKGAIKGAVKAKPAFVKPELQAGAVGKNVNIPKIEKPNVAQGNQALNKLINPSKGMNVKSTTYDTSIKALPKEIKQTLPTVTHISRNQNVMETAARKLVIKDPVKAEDTFFSRTLTAKNPDSHAKLGNALFQNAVKNGEIEKVQGIWNELKASGTQAGQSLRAYYYESMISPDGIVKYAQKIADMQGKRLSGEQFNTLKQMAKKIEKLPESEEKGKLIDSMMELARNRSLWDKSVNVAQGILSLPRAIMASADLSWGGRQGAILGSRFPKEWGKANIASPKMAFSTKAFDTKMGVARSITDAQGAPLAPLFKKMGLDLEGAYGRSEEIFGNVGLVESKFAKKIGVGHVVGGSNRAFSGAATMMRSQVAKKIIDDYGGVTETMRNWTSKDFKDLGRVINTATGRGHGGDWFEKAAPFLGQTLFSARLWKSRLDTLNPLYYARLSPVARKIALQSASSFASVIATTLMAATAAGAVVEWDPRSSDFAKVKFGNTRYDIMGGLQQNIVLAAREIKGQKKNSATGDISSLTDKKFGAKNRLTVLSDFVQNKENPALAAGSRLLRGQDIGGNPVNPWQEISKLFIPLAGQDTYATVKERGLAKGGAMSIPGYLGAGVQTYGVPVPKGKTPTPTNTTNPTLVSLQSNIPKGYSLQQTSDGRYAYTLDNGEITTTDKLKTARQAIAKDAFGKSNQNIKVIGDTVLRKSSSGSISITPKIKYDHSLNDATLTQQKKAGDMSAWMKTANKQMDNIVKQLQDPSVDQLDKIALQNQAQTLADNMAKYQGYGGFTKGGSGGGSGGKKSIPALAKTAMKTPSTKSFKVKKITPKKVATFKAPTTKKLSVSKIPSNYLNKKLG